MYSKLLYQFGNNISGLRDYVELIQPMLDEYHKQEEEKYNKALEPLAIAKQIEITEDPEIKSQLQERLKEIFDGEIEVTIKNLDEDENKEDSKRILFNVKGDTTKIDAAFEFQVKSSEQKNLLYVNSLISLLSSAEWFYSQLLHFYYDKNPHAAGIKKKTLTLEELKTFGSVSDAEKYLIDSKIESLLRSSFTDWIDTLKSELNLGLGYLKEYTEELIEIYQRRNLLVHNGGIVNSIYLSKVISSNLKLDDKIGVDEEYLENAIDRVHVLFSLIACELWKKDSCSDDERSDFLMETGYDYLKEEKWSIAMLPNIFLSKDAGQATIPKTYAKLNYWLCEKRINGMESVNKELKNLDYSDKTIVIQLALAALREDNKLFFRLLPRAINSDELPVMYLFDFPILGEMRKLKEFNEFVGRNEKVSEYLKQNELEFNEEGLKQLEASSVEKSPPTSTTTQKHTNAH